MKKIKYITVLFAVIIMTASCSKDENPDDNNTATKLQLKTKMP